MEKEQLFQKLLASHVVVSLRAQIFHWNVEGPHFFELHRFFSTTYEALQDNIDEFAERMRALGYVIPNSPETLTKESFVSVKNPKDIVADTMMFMIRDDLMAITDGCREIIAEIPNDIETIDMLTKFMQGYEKTVWQATAFLK
jgi:starvation-inducible DNA-binding protein